jgi:GNAT superfamily N-acetyltransferase
MTHGHVRAAAGLLAGQQVRRREAEPALPAAPADAGAAEPLVREALEAAGAVAYAARDGDALAGYLVAEVLHVDPASRGALYAPLDGAWVDQPACALAAGSEQRVLRALYAAVAAELVARGCLAHIVLTAAADGAAVGAWFSLGFGCEQARGARRVETPPLVALPDEVEVRPAEPADLVHVARLSEAMARAHQESPMFLPQPTAALAGLTALHAGRLADPGRPAWIALRGGLPAGMVQLGPPSPSLTTPERAIDLAESFTDPAARGLGIGTALFHVALGWAHEHGYVWMTANWRTASTLAAPHWPRLGFRPLGFRLARSLDPRVLDQRG